MGTETEEKPVSLETSVGSIEHNCCILCSEEGERTISICGIETTRPPVRGEIPQNACVVCMDLMHPPSPCPRCGG